MLPIGLATNQTISCPDGGWYFRDRCYWLIKEPTRKWSDANHYCSRTGTDLQLPVIMDNDTNVSVLNMQVSRNRYVEKNTLQGVPKSVP